MSKVVYEFSPSVPDRDNFVLKVLQNVGSAVLPFADSLIVCLQKCVHLKSKSGSNDAAKVSHVPASMSSVS